MLLLSRKFTGGEHALDEVVYIAEDETVAIQSISNGLLAL
jgi:hypothetical protein